MAKPYIEQSHRHSEASSYTLAWVFSALLVVAFALALAIWPPIFGPIKASHDTAKWVLFFGRFHPLVVHMPIGVLMFSIIIEFACLRQSIEEKWGDVALLAMFVSASSAVVGVVFGIMLTREGGFEGGAFLLHQGLGIATAVGTIIALFLRLSAMSSGGRGVMECYRFVVLLTFGMMSIGAHFGGNMVHGPKYLIQYAPDSMASSVAGFEKWLIALVEKKKPAKASDTPATKPEAKPAAENKGTTPPPAGETAKPADAASKPPATAAAGGPTVFQNVIEPIMESKCNKCHNEQKSKGDLRLDTFEMVMKGGQDDKVKNVVPGKPDESLMIKRVMLAADDDEHMPPDGKDPLTKEETALVKWWIQEGASNTLTVKDAKIPADLQATVDALIKK